MAAAELPAPAGPPASPPLAERPAGTVERADPPVAPAAPRIDRARDRLTVGRRSVRTGREPIASALVDRGAKIAVLTGRERTLELSDARTLERLGSTGAGIGPTGLATDGAELLWVTDVKGNALLVFHLRPKFQLIRRVHVPGGPYAIAHDEEGWGLWIAAAGANRLAEYSAGSRPVLRRTLPMIRDAREVSVHGNEVVVSGESEVQRLRIR